jgi:hypothetical protein
VFTTQATSSWRPDQNVTKLLRELDTRPQPSPLVLLPLLALEPARDAIVAWAAARSLTVREGILELSDAQPNITVVGFGPEDVQTFLGLAGGLVDPLLVLNPHLFDADSIRLVEGLTRDLTDPKDRRHWTGVLASAKEHLGKLQSLTAYAFAGDLSRAVVFRSTTDWAAPFTSLYGQVDDERGGA